MGLYGNAVISVIVADALMPGYRRGEVVSRGFFFFCEYVRKSARWESSPYLRAG